MPKGKASARKQAPTAGAATVTTSAHEPLPGPPDEATHAAYQRMEAAFRRELRTHKNLSPELWSVWHLLCQYDGSKHARITLGLTVSKLLAVYEDHPATILISLFLKRTLLLSGIHIHAFQQLLTQDVMPNRDNCACISLLGAALGADITPDRLGEIPPEDCQPEPWQCYESLAHMNWHPKAITLACKALSSNDTQARLASKKFLLRLLIPHELASRKAFDSAEFPSHVLRKSCEAVLSDKACMRAVLALLQEPDTLHIGILLLDAISISKEDLLESDESVTILSTLRYLLDMGAAKPLAAALNILRTRLERQQRQGIFFQSPHGFDDCGSPEFCEEMLCTLLQVMHGGAAADRVYWEVNGKQEADRQRVRGGLAWPEELVEAHMKAFFKVVEAGRLSVSCLAVYPDASLPHAAQVFNRHPAMTKTFVDELKILCTLTMPEADYNNMGLTAQLLSDMILESHSAGARLRLPETVAHWGAVEYTVHALLGLGQRLEEEAEKGGPDGWLPSDASPVVRNIWRVLQLLLCLLATSETGRKDFLPRLGSPKLSLVAVAIKRAGLEQAAFIHEEKVLSVLGSAAGAEPGDTLASAPFSSWYPWALRKVGWEVGSNHACRNGSAKHSTQHSTQDSNRVCNNGSAKQSTQHSTQRAELSSVSGAEGNGHAGGSSSKQNSSRPKSATVLSAEANGSGSTVCSNGGHGKRGSKPDRVCCVWEGGEAEIVRAVSVNVFLWPRLPKGCVAEP